MTNLVAADLLGRPVFPVGSAYEFEGETPLAAVLNGGHPGAIAAFAIGSAARADAVLIAAIHLLIQRDLAGLDGTLVAAVACLRTMPEQRGARAALPLARALDVIAEAMAGRSVRPAVDVAPPRAAADLTAALIALAGADGTVAERADHVAGAIRAAALSGADLSILSAAVVDLCYARPGRSAHLTPVLVAALEVARLADRAVAVDLLARMGRTLIIRELPENPGHQALVAPIAAAFERIHAAQDEAKAAAFQEARFRPHLLGAKPQTLVRAVAKALAFGIPRSRVAVSLTLASAERLLRFDPTTARSARRPETWLDLGWLVQIMEAIRALGVRHDRPAWIGLLLHGALWLGQSSSLDAATPPSLPEPAALARTWDHGPEIARVTGAMLRGDGETAMAVLRGYLLMVLPEQPLSAAIAAAALEDRAASAAEQGVLLSTIVAALSSFGAAATLPHRDLLPCAALHLWTQTPSPRPVFALVHAAVDRAEGGGARPDDSSPLPWLSTLG